MGIPKCMNAVFRWCRKLVCIAVCFLNGTGYTGQIWCFAIVGPNLF